MRQQPMHTLRGVPQVNTPDHLESSLKKAAAMLVAEEYRLLVVDSIIAPFRFEYCGCVRPVERPPHSWDNQDALLRPRAPVLARQAWRAGGEATEAWRRTRHAQEDGRRGACRALAFASVER